MQKWFTRQQAADYLGCSLATLDRMISRNKLTRYKVENSRSTRLDRDELDAMIKKESETKPEEDGE